MYKVILIIPILCNAIENSRKLVMIQYGDSDFEQLKSLTVLSIIGLLCTDCYITKLNKNIKEVQKKINELEKKQSENNVVEPQRITLYQPPQQQQLQSQIQQGYIPQNIPYMQNNYPSYNQVVGK